MGIEADNQQYDWYRLSPDMSYKSAFGLVKYLDAEQSYRQNENFKYMRLYGNFDLFNLRGYQYARAEQASAIQNRVTLNIIQSMCDTVVSKITKNAPKATFLTEGGDFKQQRRARKLTQFVEGQFQITDFYTKAAHAFLDSTIFGTGILKIYREDNKIEVERVFPDEITVDDRECFYNHPRQLHQKKFMHRDLLKARWPQYEKEIMSVGIDPNSSYTQNINRNNDMIVVMESWHLKSSPDAKDGKHMISIENCELFSEEYDKDYFPFIFFRWAIRPLGYFGQGLAEQLSGLQLEINKILRTIQVSMHLVSVPKIFIEASSKIVDSHIDNKIGGIIKYAGNPPTEGKLGSIPAELFAHLDRLYSRAYEIAGISQLSANAQKPAGLNSGKALREYNDLETERFMTVAKRYEGCFMQAARIFVDLAKEIDENTEKGYSVKVKGRKFLKTIKWKDVNMDEDDYVMAIFPTSALSATPAGRLQDIQELIQAGFVTQKDATKLLDFPDLEGFYDFENSSVEDIESVIEKFIDGGEYETPEPYQDLAYGQVMMQKAYLLFKSQGAPEEKLDLFRRWIEDAKALQARASAEVQAQQMALQAQAQQAQAQQAVENPGQLAPAAAPMQPGAAPAQ